MALICTGKCYECGKEIGNDEHYFCKDCFKKLREDKKIEHCPECYTWHYTQGDCLCNTAFYQCKKCGRWCIDGDTCICQLETTSKEYEKKSSNSQAEIVFRKKLDHVLANSNYFAESQKSLRQLVEKKERWKWANELNRDIDFAISKKDDYEVVLLIEYNDSTHDNPERKKRDEKVDYICKQAGYKLLFIKRDDNMPENVLRAKLECFLDL